MKFDLHLHSMYSHDALTKPSSIVSEAKKKGIVPALTDHNTCKGWDELSHWAKEETVEVILGEEISCYNNGKFCGELVGLFMKHWVAPGEYWEVVQGIKKQGALLMVPHPFDIIRSRFSLLEKIIDKVDLFEVYNSRTYFNHFNKKALKFAQENDLPMVAGSDAHTPEEIGNAFVEVEADSLEGAKHQLIAGHTKIFGEKATLADHFQTQLAKYKIAKPR